MFDSSFAGISFFFFHNQTLTDVDSKASKNLSSGSGSESGSDGGSDGDSDGDSKSDSASDSESHSDSNSDSSSDSSSDGDKSGDQDAAKRKAQVFVLYLLARSECFIFFFSQNRALFCRRRANQSAQTSPSAPNLLHARANPQAAMTRCACLQAEIQLRRFFIFLFSLSDGIASI